MAGFQRNSTPERETELAIAALKKGANLLKYGRLGKPKFFHFRLSSDHTMLIWTSDKEEKHLKLSQVSKIVPGQRTAIFHRYPRPEKEYQSFSLIYSNRSLDLICKDKEEAEVWITALKALVPQGNNHKGRSDMIRGSDLSSDGSCHRTKSCPSDASSSSTDMIYKDPGNRQKPNESFLASKWKTLSDLISFTEATKPHTLAQSESLDGQNSSSTAVDTAQISLSSGLSSSSQGSSHEDFDALADVFVWGEGISNWLVQGSLSAARMDALLPKVLEAKVALSAQNIACGSKHAMLVTKRGEIFSWGEGASGKLGHGTETDISQPKVIDALIGSSVESAACGDCHTCVVTGSGDLYSWGDGNHRLGILGHGSEVSYWTPKKVCRQIEGVHVTSVSCGPWHTAIVTSAGKLFTFGDGTFGALGHGDLSSTLVPREVENLKQYRTMRASCGVWHSAAVVQVTATDISSAGKLFTWGSGDKGQLGHGDMECRLVPSRIAVPDDTNFCQVACGDSFTIGLTAAGKVYTMGSREYGQLGSPGIVGKLPTCIEGSIKNSQIKEISCGSHHVAVLSSHAEVYTWGKGANGQLGHGDTNNRKIPTLVEALKEKQVMSVVCGSNFTAAIGIHNSVSNIDHSACSSCRNPFNFMRKRHNCYNCGLVVCSTCSSKKSLKASLAPITNKPFRVCDDCFVKLKNPMESGPTARIPKVPSGNIQQNYNDVTVRETLNPKFHGRLSKLATFDMAKETELQDLNCNRKSDVNSYQASLAIHGSFRWGSFHMSRTLSSRSGNSQKTCASDPVSRMASRATSPVSIWSSPYSLTTASPSSERVHSEVTLDGSLSKEVIILRSQVEDLTRKSKALEAELDRTSRQLKDVSVIAEEEAEKNKAAKEVLRSLSDQLKEMADGAPEESRADRRSSTSDESGSTVAPVLSNGRKETSEKAVWMVKEPGIYLTLSSFPGGGNHFKQVQISRKHFSSELEAEKWWAENISKLSY